MPSTAESANSYSTAFSPLDSSLKPSLPPKVLMLSAHSDEAYVEAAVGSGAMGYLGSSKVPPARCAARFGEVHKGNGFFSSSLPTCFHSWNRGVQADSRIHPAGVVPAVLARFWGLTRGGYRLGPRRKAPRELPEGRFPWQAKDYLPVTLAPFLGLARRRSAVR